jgi:uncharacterized membrane protein YjgN (DUF898 family)
LFLIFIIAPYATLVVRIKSAGTGSTPFLFFFLIILMIMMTFVLTFYIAKLSIENIAFREKSMAFNGTFGKFMGTVLLGFFLTIITLGIYGAWFVRDLHRFYINNSSYDLQPLKFQGKGVDLFVILLLTVFLPVIVLSLIMAGYLIRHADNISFISLIIQQSVILLMLIPYLYLFALEILLSLITAGIYMPLAQLRLYKYFTDRTTAKANDRILRFGFDADQLNDFLFIWGQILLTIITLGIYFPWACCKIGKRIIGKTYLLMD